jgi:hypothetical protein
LIKKREKKTTFICGKCRNTTAHSSQNVLQRNTLYYMKWIKYKTVCAELSFAIAHSHLGQNGGGFYMKSVIFALFAMQLNC